MTVNQPQPKDPLVEIGELADELTDTRDHIEHIYGWTPARHRKLLRTHQFRENGLLQQLRDAVHGPALHNGEEQRHERSTASRPPLQLEALARLIEIELGVNGWIHNTATAHRGNTESNLRALVGAAPRLDSETRHQLLLDLRRWRAWAAVMSGWALPPYHPDVLCPRTDCGQRATIRIILERKTGLCVACQTIWDDRDGSINLLAAYIAEETERPHERIPVGSTVEGHGGWDGKRTT